MYYNKFKSISIVFTNTLLSYKLNCRFPFDETPENITFYLHCVLLVQIPFTGLVISVRQDKLITHSKSIVLLDIP